MKQLITLIILALTLYTPAFGATRAVQVESLLTGIVTGTGGVLSGGKVYTYAAGTTTAKTTWTDANKTTPQTNPIILDAAGRATVFADGLYKFVIQTSAGAAVKTLDGLKYRYPVSSVITKIANYTTTVEDDVVLVDASAGAVTITLHAVATADYPITIKKIDSSANAVTIDPNGAETIDGAATVVIATQNTVSQLYSDGSTWRGGQQILTADNSDKLDGFHASQAPGVNEIPVLDSNTNIVLPKITMSSYGFIGIPANNKPATYDTAYSYLQRSDGLSNGGGVATAIFPEEGEVYFRKSTNSITGAGQAIEWGTKEKIWHSGNDGAASTLDADFLDGNSSAYFINTSNIGSQTVSAATTATTATNSAGTGSIPYVRYENGLRIVRGTVNSDGTLALGSGFTSSLDATGVYHITFSHSFNVEPTCTVTLMSSTGQNLIVVIDNTGTSASGLEYFTKTSAGVSENVGSSFICIGPN